MIRSVHIPRGVSRMGASPGSVGMNAGGSATSYSYDATGLSNDPQLAPYLQNLTPAQVQSALDGGDSVTGDLTSLLTQDQTGTGAGSLPDAGGVTGSSIPMWAWLAGGGILAFAVLKR